ncbi:MAG: glycosyltransferase family 1 protein [Candidatus Eremiobacteraeota bacterium]|nr:glycosyltransferase family 1 protein [Candidatus Eremiobacteraeota bacterium]
MRYFWLPSGSHGDVLPLVGLARELQRRGHDCLFFANPAFEAAIQGAQLELHPIGTVEEYQIATSDPDLYHPRKGLKTVGKFLALSLERDFEAMLERLSDQPTVLVGTTLSLAVRCLADYRQLPAVTVHLQPSVIRSHLEPPLLDPTARQLPPWLDRALWFLLDHLLVDPLLAAAANRLRKRLGLPRIRSVLGRYQQLADLSLLFFPEWFSGRPSDWPDHLEFCGFPLYDLEGADELEVELEGFLAKARGCGRQIVVFTGGTGFGNLPEFYTRAVEACEDRAGILLTRHPANLPESLPDNVFTAHYAPFSRLLSRVDAIVHHGGIGTLSQALAAGIPQVICPLAHDQFDNARRIERLGYGVWCRQPDQLKASLSQALGAEGPDLQLESGLDRAADCLERFKRS